MDIGSPSNASDESIAQPASPGAVDGGLQLSPSGCEPDSDQLERFAALLDSSPDYRVLRRLRSSSRMGTTGTAHRRGLFVDVETTGLDPVRDRVLELGMLAFDYSVEGELCAVGESFEAFSDPGRPIPSEVTALTGIDETMVAGKSIDPEKVAAFVGRADLIVAHNAEFDRAFCERLSDAFVPKAWACSYREVGWTSEGFDSARLGHLAIGHGLFFDAHRALDDCRAALEILSRPLLRSGRTALAALLESARRPRFRIRAIGAPFIARAALKSRGFRWNDGSNGAARAWFVDVDEQALEAECEFLRSDVYHRADIAVEVSRFTAIDRYSERCR